MVREDVEDFFAPFARIRARRMFSGYGAYIDDACFALVIRGAIWIKTDEESERGALTAAGSEPFNYTRPDGRHVVMSAFWRLPDARWTMRTHCAAGARPRSPPRRGPLRRKRGRRRRPLCPAAPERKPGRRVDLSIIDCFQMNLIIIPAARKFALSAAIG